MITWRSLLTVLLLSISLSNNLAFAFSTFHQASDAVYAARNGDFTVTVLDSNGKPVPGALVNYNQLSRDFLLGFPAFSMQVLWPYVGDVKINYLEVYATWKLTEDSGFLGWLDYWFTPITIRNSGLTLSAHCFVWFVADPQAIAAPDNLPTWVQGLSYDELKTNLYNHVYTTVGRLKSIFKYYDINEPFWPYENPFHLSTNQWMEILNISVRAIKTADPTAMIYLNFLLGDYPKWGYYPLQYVKQVEDAGIAFDAIGLELYSAPTATPGVPLDANGYPQLSWVSKRLDQFGELGKPLILTEVDASANPGEKAQADWLSKMYEMAFAKPYMKGISWSYAFEYPIDHPFLPGAGLFDCTQWSTGTECETARPKPAYYALKNLTTSWLTQGSGTTDSNGVLGFKGFGGSYSINITAPGLQPVQTIVHLKEQTLGQIEIKMAPESTQLWTMTSTSLSTSVRSQGTILSQVPTDFYLVILIGSIAVFAAGAVYLVRRRQRRNH